MKKIIAVSAGQLNWKKKYSGMQKHLHYLNYGLLGLVSLIDRFDDCEIKMFQAEGSVEDLLSDILAEGIDITKDCDYILLSIPSCYSISWSEMFCHAVHRISPAKIIAGGRWVVDNHNKWIHDKLKYESCIIQGFGEGPLAEVLGINLPEEYRDGSKRCFDYFDYKLLHSYQLYSPSIEISRGCGAGCQFCADGSNYRLPNKSVQLVMKELDYLDEIYEDYTVYFEAPHFVFEREWIDEFYNSMMQRKRVVPWRCTTRVESVPIEDIGKLAKCGMKILDIGLESASKTQLLRMKKTKRPDEYLARAEQLLQECAKYNVFVKFNILLYAGETYQTVAETANWLNKNSSLIKDVSVSNLVYYHNMNSLDELKQLGASITENNCFLEEGYSELRLSLEIDAKEAARIGHELSCIVANQKDYFDIKKFSYFDPYYTYEEFLRDLESYDSNLLPFRIEEEYNDR